MNSCNAYVDRVWDEGEAFEEGVGGGVLSKKKTGILVVSLLIEVKNCRSRPQLGCAGRKQDELLLRPQIFSHTYRGISHWGSAQEIISIKQTKHPLSNSVEYILNTENIALIAL